MKFLKCRPLFFSREGRFVFDNCNDLGPDWEDVQLTCVDPNEVDPDDPATWVNRVSVNGQDVVSISSDCVELSCGVQLTADRFRSQVVDQIIRAFYNRRGRFIVGM